MKLHQLLDPYVIHKLNKIRGPSSVQSPQAKWKGETEVNTLLMAFC